MQAQRKKTHIFLADPEEYYRVRVAEAILPYEKGKGFALPDVDPFNISIQLSGDDGMTLNSLYVQPDGNIRFFYNTELVFVDGRIHIERPVGPEDIILDIEIRNS